MASRSKGKHGVLLCQVPVGWRPTHFSTFPPEVVLCRWYARRLHLHVAAEVVRTFNLQRLEGRMDGQWCLLVVQPKSCARYCQRVAARVSKGGAR